MANIAVNKTAAALMSLMALICGFISVVTKSQALSIAELNISAEKTSVIAKQIHNHSVALISK